MQASSLKLKLTMVDLLGLENALVSINWTSFEKNMLQQFITFCELNQQDVLLDTNCRKGELLTNVAPIVEHALGITNDADDYTTCKKEICNNKNVDLIFCKLASLPFKKNIFTILVNYFSFLNYEDINSMLKDTLKYCGFDGRFGIQDFYSYDNEKINDFFKHFDGEVNHCESSKIKYLNQEVLIENDFKIIRQSVEEIEFNAMYYIARHYKTTQDLDQINKLINQARQDEILSKYIYLKNDQLTMKRKILSVMAINQCN